ncbi:MAG: hypothetical protein KDE20_21675 [Caldilineaceae bacterium]|nr:hypothetical protein [Anaerolineae bacterium]MCB0074096.1 hypothetical protein [Caldilineaceae bacterium]MCB0231603.1 hypothetical protein [Anaerolineae bacterium]
MAPPAWLPPLVLFADHDGNWNVYVEVLYGYYHQDFVNSRPVFDGQNVGTKRHPIESGKEATFWHLISEGKAEQDRLPDLRRCERIRWTRPTIEHSKDADIKVWQNQRRGETRVCVWCEEAEYLVVLAKRSGYYLLWTAYPVVEEHRKRKLRNEYETYKRLAPP